MQEIDLGPEMFTEIQRRGENNPSGVEGVTVFCRNLDYSHITAMHVCIVMSDSWQPHGL